MSRHTTAYASLAIFAVAVQGCAWMYSAQPPHLIESGLYEVEYRYYQVTEAFGPDRTTAVPSYLKKKGLVPPECVNGITVVRGGELEYGGAWAEFRCK